MTAERLSNEITVRHALRTSYTRMVKTYLRETPSSLSVRQER